MSAPPPTQEQSPPPPGVRRIQTYGPSPGGAGGAAGRGSSSSAGRGSSSSGGWPAGASGRSSAGSGSSGGSSAGTPSSGGAAAQPASGAGNAAGRPVITGNQAVDGYLADVESGARTPVPVTGVPLVDVAGDMVNDTLAPFVTVPRNEDGSRNWVAYTAGLVGGVLGILGLAETALDYGVSILLAPFAQAFSMPAARLTDLHVGVPHGHLHPPSLVPPNPVPIPLPSLGALMGSGAINVLIGGMPAARAGDIGLAPTCFSTAPAFLVITGSSSVFIGGGRAARMGDLTIHCNPILAKVVQMQAIAATLAVAGAVAGFVASAAQGKWEAAVAGAAQAAADLARDAIRATVGMDPAAPPVTPSVMGAIVSGAPNVMIGGLPVPPADILMGILKGEVEPPGGPRRARGDADADADPENPRPTRRSGCEC